MKKDRLRAAINRSGIKQTRIAELLAVNVNTVSRWLSGGFNPTDDKKLKLAEILGTTVYKYALIINYTLLELEHNCHQHIKNMAEEHNNLSIEEGIIELL